jgi:hypothetical protein
MNLPGFTAEAALQKTSDTYRQGQHRFSVAGEGAITPARGRGFPCSMCDDICAGGTFICDRWCACACRGGTHCGLPD